MAVKKCCVENCNSCSTRKEDIGVTYHKFPKDTTLRDIWISVSHRNTDQIDLRTYVCSRHFCKSDFQIYKDSKYVLKSDAVPSIFSWNMKDNKTPAMEDQTSKETVDSVKELNSSKESEGENVEAIKQFIKDQDKVIADQVKQISDQEKQISDKKKDISDMEKEVSDKEKEISSEEKQISEQGKDISDQPNVQPGVKTVENVAKEPELSVKEEPKINKDVEKPVENVDEILDETMAVASSVMDMILSESEARIAAQSEGKALASGNPGDKGNSTSLSVGSKVEAKDYAELWYAAQIIEVDCDEMEVLVHYDDVFKKHDEWISVSSPRLRPKGSKPSTPIPEVPLEADTAAEPAPVSEPKPDEKRKVTYAVDERCLARWRDNRRFAATVTQDLGDGKYEIMFDDGVRWTCTASRLSKLKEETRKDRLSVDTCLPSTASTPSPDYGPGPSSGVPTTVPLPAYHTHLFDPTRDYLGSKSERREMKRKLNIKEIFNIGQKKKKVEVTPKEKTPKVVKEQKPKVVRRKIKVETDVKVKTEVKKEIPDSVASIIGAVAKETVKEELNQAVEIKEEDIKEEKMDINESLDIENSETLSAPETMDLKHDEEPVAEQEAKLEQFEQTDDVQHNQVIVRIKEAINKLEDGLNQVDNKDLDPQLEIKEEILSSPKVVSEAENQEKPKEKKSFSKIKKGKKLRLLQEKKVKKQVERAKCELEEIKKQVAEMKKEMLIKTEELAKVKGTAEMPESFLLPGEWCCKWVNGQPVGTVSELESEAKVDSNNKPILPRRSVQVEDKRLPEGWTKHMVRRSVGNSAGKWDVVLVGPDNHRFHTKTDMRNYLENNPNEALKPYEDALMDFGVHLKLARRMGWYSLTPGYEPAVVPLPAGTLATTSPLVKRKKLTLKKNKLKQQTRKKLCVKLKVPRQYQCRNFPTEVGATPGVSGEQHVPPVVDIPPLEDGYVYVGSLKVQIIENLLRCPADNCFKNFRNNTLLKMHIKHYHRELRKMLGATPKVLDLAYARTRPSQIEMRRLKFEAENKTVRIKIPRLPKRLTGPKPVLEPRDLMTELYNETPSTPIKTEGDALPTPRDSPKLRIALTNKPVKRPKVLLPVRRPELETVEPKVEENEENSIPIQPITDIPNLEALDFETAISTHTVTKPIKDSRRKGEKKRKSFATIAKKTVSEDEEWFSMNNNSDVETRSSYPRSGTPDSKNMDQKLVSSESNEEQKDPNAYMYTDTGERIKIVHMKREEIINCHCGVREEDGLMVQCELCLCWQHALCHNIQKESEVPEKYTCSICLNPRRGRRSQRFLHDQDRLYEGLLPGAKPCESLRRSHELSGNLLRIEDALHALRVKYYVATKKDHPKLYLWAKDWEAAELTMTQEKLNSDYSDLNIMISNIGKENLPVKPDDINMSLNIGTPPSEEQDRFNHRGEGLGSQALLSGLLSSPGGASLDLPISTLELERLAKTVQEQEVSQVIVPQPEAAIENSACRERLLKHIQRCQALIDARLDSIEAQVAELESQDPSFEDDETADYCPRTKQTIVMLSRDLDTMEELGNVT